MSGVELPKKVYYWGLRGGLAPTCLLLEMAEAKIEFEFFTSYESWHKKRDEVPGRFPTGQLPAMELADGTIIPESGALKRSVAAATGRLGAGKDYMTSEALMGISDDLKKLVNSTAPNVMNMGIMGGGAKTYSEEQAKKCVEETRPKVVATLEKIAGMLEGEAKDRFTTSGETCGEVDLLWTLHMVETVHPGILGSLQAFYSRLRANAGIARYIEGTGTYSTPQTPTWVLPLPA
jgi:glutathione S-transferase